jgi:hypothetical protein
MHYRSSTPKDENAGKVLMDVREWLANDAAIQQDRKRLDKICCAPELPIQLQGTPKPLSITFHSDASHRFLAKTKALRCESASMTETISSNISATIFSFKVFAEPFCRTTSFLNISASYRDKMIWSNS